MDIKGQDKLISAINELTLDTFPRSLLLEGPQGCGKSVLVQYISQHLGISIIDISEKLTFEDILEYSLRSDPYVYLIDKKLSIKEQNTILKFLEEPPSNAIIIIECQNINSMLSTILNRCVVWKFAQYTKDILEEFIVDKSVSKSLLSICKTPGDVLNFSSVDVDSELAFAEKIFLKINKANYPNALTLSRHIRFSNEQDKIPLELFVVILKYVLFKNLQGDAAYAYAVNDTLELCNSLNIPNIDKKYLFETYITNLWKSARGVYGT